MPDREKLIKALECNGGMVDDNGEWECHDCPYCIIREDEVGNWSECGTLQMFRDAIALLREQEPQMVHAMQFPNYIAYYCPRCKNPVEFFYAGEFNHYCAFCGQAIDFDTIHWLTPPEPPEEVSGDADGA